VTSHRASGLADHRDRLFGLAYRMLGSVADAEDVVQDVGETWTRTDTETIEDPEAWLVTVTTRRCLDRLRSAQRRRETYVGPWLPEPLVTDPVRAPAEADPGEAATLADEVSYALLVVLDRLQPAERVAFVLHDVFGEPFEHVARILGRTPAAARKLASRARQRVHGALPTATTDPAEGRRVTEAFVEAVGTGDLAALLELLAPDTVLVSDGGGIVSAARRPVHGADRLARFFLGLAAKGGPEARAEPVTVNGGPGVRLWLGRDLVGVAALGVRQGRVLAVHVVTNPHKLAGAR
jgi:RNA polymerase sigma-70 factor, ECF subfamily